MDDDTIVEAVIPEAEKILRAPARELFVAVVDRKYPWLVAHHVVWARTRDFRSALFSVAPRGPPVQLNGDDALGRVSISSSPARAPSPGASRRSSSARRSGRSPSSRADRWARRPSSGRWSRTCGSG